MNKQEAIEKINNLKGLTILDKIINFDDEMISKKEVLNIVKQIDELEKLYTVEIPNPDCPDKGKFALCKNKSGKVFMKWTCLDDWKFLDEFQLTEEEVKEKFDWAWKFAEVAEE